MNERDKLQGAVEGNQTEFPNLLLAPDIQARYFELYRIAGEGPLGRPPERHRTVRRRNREASLDRNGKNFTALSTEITANGFVLASNTSLFALTKQETEQIYQPDELVPTHIVRLQGLDEKGQSVVVEYTQYSNGGLDQRAVKTLPITYGYAYTFEGREVTLEAGDTSPFPIDEQKKIADLLGIPQQ